MLSLRTESKTYQEQLNPKMHAVTSGKKAVNCLFSSIDTVAYLKILHLESGKLLQIL